MRIVALLGLVLLVLGCARGERATPGDQGRGPLGGAGRTLTLQVFQLRTDLEAAQEELAAVRHEIGRAALAPEARRRLEAEAETTRVALDRALARVTELESSGGWAELEDVRRQSRRLALRVAALRVALESAVR